jgi:multidrug efflux system outer membrane protein
MVASVDVGWELDLFGRVSQRINAAEAISEAMIADYHDLQITVAAEVASTYMDLRGAQLRFDIANRNANNQNTTLTLTNSLVDAGVGNDLDKARAKTQLSLTRASLPQRKADIQTAIYRLSVLTGKPPLALENLLQKASALPSLPPVVNVGEQERVLQSRPDVRRAERRLAASVARYNIATRDFLPEFSLNGTLGFAATNFSSLDQSGSIVSALGLNFRWNGLDFGRVNANIDQQDALAQAALAEYEQTVLLALEEIQRSVTEFSEQEQTRAQLLEAVKAASIATAFARQRFNAGESDFLAVLDAERVQLQAEDALAQSEISSALQLVRLYKSLGKGWSIDA